METKEPQMESISLSETPQPAGLDSTTTTMANADWEKSKCIPNADKSSISKHTPLVSSHLPRWASNISQPASWIRSRKDTTRTSSHKPQIASQFSEEIWKLFTTLGLFVAIVVILRTQHGKLQPNWRHVNLSALIAILATLLRASMMAVVSEAMSQLKWTWFSVPRSLRDLDYFDQASRGVWGSMKLLSVYQTLHPAFLGAVITILSFGIGPFGQQAIKSVSCQVPEYGINATVPIAHNLTEADVYRLGVYALDMDFGTKGALTESLVNPIDSTSKLVTNCPGGNCTFPNLAGVSYSSIGICTKCKDTTSEIVEGEAPPGPQYYGYYPYIYNYTLPKSNITIYNTERMDGDFFVTKTSRPYTDGFGQWEEPYNTSALGTIDVLSYTARTCRQKWMESKDVYHGSNSTKKDLYLFCDHVRPELKTLKFDLDVIASQCVLYPCLKNYQANITAGVLSEEIVSTVPALRSSSGNNAIVTIPCFLGGQQYDFSNFSKVPEDILGGFVRYNPSGSEYKIPTGCFYSMDGTYAEAFMQFFEVTVNGTGHGQDLVRTSWGKANNITDYLTFEDNWWLSLLYRNGNTTLEAVSAIFDKVGDAFTNHIRTSPLTSSGSFQDTPSTRQAEFAYGISYRSGVCTKFDWKWLLFPAVLLFGTIMVFLHTMLITYTDPQGLPVWKSSILPLLYYRLHGANNEFGTSEMPRHATNSSSMAHVLETEELEDIASRHVVTFNRTETGAGFYDVDT